MRQVDKNPPAAMRRSCRRRRLRLDITHADVPAQSHTQWRLFMWFTGGSCCGPWKRGETAPQRQLTPCSRVVHGHPHAKSSSSSSSSSCEEHYGKYWHGSKGMKTEVARKRLREGKRRYSMSR